jgi:hypothetical protein
MSGKLVPARNMNGMITSCVTIENASIERASGENPPVGIVVRPWVSALYGVIAGSRFSAPTPSNSRISIAVIAA